MVEETRCMRCMTPDDNILKQCPVCGYINGSQDSENNFLTEGLRLNKRYVLGCVLGHGGFGITYIGYDETLDTKVAIKEYLPSDLSARSGMEKSP